MTEQRQEENGGGVKAAETIELAPEVINGEEAGQEAESGIKIESEGLSSREIEDAKELGLTIDETGKGAGTDKAGVQAGKEKPDTADEAIKKFEKEEELTVDEEHAVLDKLDKKSQAFYFKMKEDRKKRQAATTQVKLLQDSLDSLTKEIEQLKNKNKGSDLENEQTDLLKDPDKKAGEEDDSALLTKADLKKALEDKEKKDKEQEENKDKTANLARAIAEKWVVMEDKAKETVNNYDAVMDLAKEIIEKDESGAFGAKMVSLSENCLAIEDGKPNAIDFALTIAKLHPDYQKVISGKISPASSKENIQKIVENSKKRSSAGVTGGGNIIAIDDITQEIAARMPSSQFAKLPKWKQEQLLGNPNAKAPTGD